MYLWNSAGAAPIEIAKMRTETIKFAKTIVLDSTRPSTKDETMDSLSIHKSVFYRSNAV